VERPLWREEESVIYFFKATGPCHRSHSPLQVPQNSWPCLTLSFDTSLTWRVRSPHIYLPGTGWPLSTLGSLLRQYMH
jgi:hypothetical protein